MLDLTLPESSPHVSQSRYEFTVPVLDHLSCLLLLYLVHLVVKREIVFVGELDATLSVEEVEVCFGQTVGEYRLVAAEVYLEAESR
jgi:hypothetical protein